MLNSYLTTVQELLENPLPNPPLYSTADLTNYINIARNQVAGESGCIRALLTLSTLNGQQSYPFSGLTGLPIGALEPYYARMITVAVSGGSAFIDFRPWEWFNRYLIATTTIANAQPQKWTQYGQGVSGKIFLSPTPDAIYTATVDASCQPIALVNDSTPEAIPYPWTDAVPFYAAYYAYMSAQRQDDANIMFQRYEEFTARARLISTPDIVPMQFNQRGPSPQSQQAGG